MGNKHSSRACQCLSPKRKSHPAERLVLNSHQSQTTHWAPPTENWDSGNGLPYGWETGVDKTERKYYISHVERITTRADPREEPDYVEPPKPREVELSRDPQLGFGFVAGSEKPVIVRFVTEGGPSEEKLLPGDQIVEINHEDVKKAPREYVIELVRSCKDSVVLTVCQPHIDNSTRKSALLTAAKKARLKNNPSRVRFAESVIVNGAPHATPSTQESYVPFMPNVLKVFLENGQTKSFKYDNKTTVKDVLASLQEKLNLRCMEHFSLALQNMKSASNGRLTLLQDQESLAEIAARPGSQHFKCLFRVAFVPQDAYDLLRKDATAFEYFYMQCCNDVVQGRFASELKYDIALRLAALHMQQHAITSSMQGKLTVKAVEKECGLDKFVPATLLGSMKAKDLRKMIAHYLKANQNLTAPGQKSLTALQAKLHYMKIISELRSFGGKLFIATLVERKTEAMLLVGPKCGIAVVTNIKTNSLAIVAEFHQLEALTMTREGETLEQVHIHSKQEPVLTSVSMLSEDAHDFIALVEGYHRLVVGSDDGLLRLESDEYDGITAAGVPPYHAKHDTVPMPWSYTEEILNESQTRETEDGATERLTPVTKQPVDLAIGPPSYQERFEDDSKKSDSDLSINGVSRPAKPSELRTKDFAIHAPLASPDTSNISSSESSINVSSPERDSHRLSLEIADRELSYSSLDEATKDADSITDSSVSTVISRTTLKNGSSMDSTLSNVDSRFGVSSFRTFSSESALQTDASDISSCSLTPTNDNRLLPLDGDVENNNPSATLSPHDDSSTSLTLDDDVFEECSGQLQERSLSETDTESVSESMDSESMYMDTKCDYVFQPDGIAEGLQSESDDTDSMSTPTDSPSKGRLESADVEPPPLKIADQDRPQSFGLHSPDQLPKSEQDFEAIASSFGLCSPDNLPADTLHPSYNPRLFCDGGLYLDPEIIDLTLIPPPKTPDDECLIDFGSNMTIAPAPPGFTDETSPERLKQLQQEVTAATMALEDLPPDLADLPTPIREQIDALVMSDQELGVQLAAMDALLLEDPRFDMPFRRELEKDIESETDSGNETISSENVEVAGGWVEPLPECLTMPQLAEETKVNGQSLPHSESDLDAFLARVAVPPPPGRESSPEEFDLPPPPVMNVGDRKSQDSLDSLPPPPSPQVEAEVSEEEQAACEPPPPPLEDEFAQFVIPPPPSSEEMALGDIPIVPPVDVRSPVLDGPSVAELVARANAGKWKNTTSPDNILRAVVRPVQSVREDGASPGVQGPESSNLLQAKHMFRHSQIKSADSSPIHKGHDFLQGALSGSTGMLHRKGGGRVPPPPPPRKSSIPSLQEDPPVPHPKCSSADNTPPCNTPSPGKEMTRSFEQRHSNYVNAIIQQAQSNSEPTLCRIERGKRNSRIIEEKPDPSAEPKAEAPRRGSIKALEERGCSVMARQAELSKALSSFGGIPTPEKMRKRQKARHRSETHSTSSDTDAEGLPEETSSAVPVFSKPEPMGSRFIPPEVSEELPPPPAEDLDCALERPTIEPVPIASKADPTSSNTASPKLAQRHRSPSFTRKLLTFEIGKKDSDNSSGGESSGMPDDTPVPYEIQLQDPPPEEPDTPPPSPSLSYSQTLGRSSTFTSSSPKPGSSPKASPSLHRHSSFGRLAERAASPLRQLFGGGSAEHKRTSSDSDVGDAPPSPRRSLRSSWTISRSGLKPFGNGSQGKDKKGIPLKIVHPLMATSSSESNMAEPAMHDWSLRAEPGTAVGPGEKKKDAKKSEDKKRVEKVSSPAPIHREWAMPIDDDSRANRTFSTFKDPKKSTLRQHSAPMELNGSKTEEAQKNMNNSNSESSVSHTVAKQGIRLPQMGSGEGSSSPSASAKRKSMAVKDRSQSLEGPTPISADTIIQKTYYGADAFHTANKDVDALVMTINKTMQDLNLPSCRRPTEEFQTSKESLVNESRQFVTDSKLLVSSATQSTERLVENVNQSIHTLAKIVKHAQLTMLTMIRVPHAHSLGSKVKEVAEAYKMTVTAAYVAAGRPLSDPYMKTLMRQATTLASILSSLMKTLKILENS